MKHDDRSASSTAEGREALLLRVVLCPDGEARASWKELRTEFDLDLVGGATSLVLPALGERLSTLGVDDPVVPRLRGLQKRSWYMGSLLLSDLARAVDVLARARVPALAIRGAALALTSYASPERRVLRDADLMVRPDDMASTLAVLGAADWRRTVEPPRSGRRRGIAVLHNSDGRTLRVHDALSPALPGSGDDPDLWARSTKGEWRGSELPVPSPEDCLIQVCVDRAADAPDATLRSVADIVVTLQAADVDWALLDDLARRHRASIQVHAALRHAREAFGAPVPAGVLEGLASAPTSKLERVAARVDAAPREPLGRVPRIVTHLARTADRDSPRAVVAELGNRLATLPGAARSDANARVRRRRRAVRRRANGRLIEAAVRSIHTTPQRATLGELVERADLATLPKAAADHNVVGHVHHALSGVDGVDQHTRVRLASLHLHSQQRHRRVLDDLRVLHDALESSGIRWLIIKGPVLSEHLYEQNDLRVYNDLDVVVPRAQFVDAIKHLRHARYELIDRNWELVRDRFAGQVHLQRDGGPEIDLHWHLLFGAQLRSEFSLDVEEMIERAREVRVDGLPVLTLDPADTVIHLALHAAMEGGHRVVWLADLDRAIADGPDWAWVVERARRWRVHLAVGTMLLRTQSVMGTQVPRAVLRELVPSNPWRSTLRLVDRLFPPGAYSGHGNIATLVTRSSRSDMRSTLSTAWAGLRSRALHAASTNTLERPDVRGNPTHPGSLAYARGGEPELAEYLEAVSEVQ